MKFQIKNEIIIFILIILFSLIVRYPLIPHEVGADTYYIHSLSDGITTSGEVEFISHPLQFLGFSSQPPTIPILISGLSQSTALSSEYTILLLSLIVTILCIFTYYILIYTVTKNKFQSFFATIIFSTAPEIMRLTLWTATTRALFMALFPLLFYFILKLSDKNKRLSSILLLILLIMMLLSTHHLGALIVLVIVTFIISIILTKNNFEININSRKFPSVILWSVAFIFLLSLLIFRIGFFKDHMNFWGIYTHGVFFNDDSPKSLFSNMIIDYVSKINILMILAPLGIFALFYTNKKRSLFENYALVSLIISAPIVGVGVYTPMFISIILVFLISTGAITLLKIVKIKNLSQILVLLMIVVSLCFSTFMMFHWGYKTIKSDNDRYMPESKNTAKFLQTYGGNGSFTSNERGGAVYKYWSYSGMMGAPRETFEKDSNLKAKLRFNASDLIGGGVESIIVFESENGTNKTENSTSQIDNSLDETDDSTSDAAAYSVWYEYPKLWSGNVDEGRDIINKYGIEYVLETQFGTYSISFVKNMKFFNDIHESKPLIYDNDKEKIYSLQKN